MELKFSKIVDGKQRTIDMFIYGLIGCTDEDTGRYFDGHEFAKELRWVGQHYDQINVHLNCEGGSVVQGLSIKASFSDVDAKIVTINDGICASMGTMILMNGDEVEVKDYAKTMFHMAYLVDEKGKHVKNISAKQQEGLDMANDTLFRLVKKRGKSDDEAKDIITPADKWFTPEDLMEKGLVDRIIDTGKKKELAALEPKSLVAKINHEHNSKSMKKVIARLKSLGVQLAEDATEDQIVAALDVLPANNEKPSELLVDRMLALGKKLGVVTEGDTGNEAKFRKLAEADMDLFVDMLGIDQLEPKAQHPKERMSTLVNKAQGKKSSTDAGEDEKTFEWYEKNNPEALAKMEVHEPEKFAKLEAADKAKYE